MLLQISGALQGWTFKVEINTRCDPQIEHVHAFSPSGRMIYSHLESVFVHTVGVSKQERGRVRREDEVHLDLGHIFIIGLTPSMLHAYITSKFGCVWYTELFPTNSSVVNYFCVCVFVNVYTYICEPSNNQINIADRASWSHPKLEFQVSILVPFFHLNPQHRLFFFFFF